MLAHRTGPEFTYNVQCIHSSDHPSNNNKELPPQNPKPQDSLIKDQTVMRFTRLSHQIGANVKVIKPALLVYV